MPKFKKILPAIVVAGAIAAMAGVAFAGPNANAKFTATLDKSTGVKAGDQVVLTISATGLATCNGYTAEALFDSTAVTNAGASAKLASAISPGSTADANITPAIAGYNRRLVTGGAQLGGTPVTGNSDIATMTFTAAAGFTTAKIAVRWLILNTTGGVRDTVVAAPLLVLQINPPAPKVAISPKSASRNFNQTQVLTATYSAAGDTISWTASGTVAGGNIRITAAADTIPGQIRLPLSLTATASTFRTKTAATGSTITLAATGTGRMTATIIVAAGTTRDTATVVFDVPVPAELSTFAGTPADGKVKLDWTTVSQTNNAGWRVLRSTDNVTFEPVSGLVPGAGTSNEQLVYTYTDFNLPKDVEKVFYILEQVDLDGKITRSRFAEVLLGGRFTDMPKEFSTAVFPNPFNPSTTIAYNLPDAARVNIVIYDAIGQEIRTLVAGAQTSAGRYTAQWDAKDNAGRQVASGVYFAHITAGKFTGKQKMLLLK